MKIRKMSLNDLEELKRFGKQTFHESFAAQNTAENIADYLQKGFSTEKLKAELGNINSEFYIIKKNSQSIGYLKLNYGEAQTDLKNDNALEIERIYVLKELQGQKVGQILYNKAVEIAKKRNVEFIWLGVWDKNYNAIGFYKRLGFVEFEKHPFMLGSDLQTDIMMKKILNSNEP